MVRLFMSLLSAGFLVPNVMIVNSFLVTRSRRNLMFRSVRPADEIREDISRLEHEANERLQNLLEQMDDLESFEKNSVPDRVHVQQKATKTDDVGNDKGSHLTDSMDMFIDDTQPPEKPSIITTTKSTTKVVEVEVEKVPLAFPPTVATNLLEGTSWRLVFNIGREEGTWMPKDWGISGERLRVECKVRFTNNVTSAGREDFFNPKPYRLEVSEGFVWPTGVGVGRKPLKFEESGDALYQVVTGTDQGDILRMRVQMPQALNRSDVLCPAGHVYVTASYFGLPECHCQKRENALERLMEAQAAYEKAERDLKDSQQQEQPWWGVWKPMAEVWKTKHAFEEKQIDYQEAQQRYPEKRHLRFDSAGRVALSKEGGLCLKINSGVAIEYHILGRVEFGCIDKKDVTP